MPTPTWATSAVNFAPPAPATPAISSNAVQAAPQAAPQGGYRLTDGEQLRFVKHAINNVDLYRAPKKRGAFWAEMTRWCAEELGNDIKHPNKLLSKYVGRQKERNDQALRASGVALASTDLDQALDYWIQMDEDHKEVLAKKKDAQNKEEEDKTVAHVARDNMMRRHSRKRPLEGQDDAIVIDDDDNLPPAPAPKKRESDSYRERIVQAIEKFDAPTRAEERTREDLESLKRSNQELEVKVSHLCGEVQEQKAMLREVLDLLKTKKD